MALSKSDKDLAEILAETQAAEAALRESRAMVEAATVRIAKVNSRWAVHQARLRQAAIEADKPRLEALEQERFNRIYAQAPKQLEHDLQRMCNERERHVREDRPLAVAALDAKIALFEARKRKLPMFTKLATVFA